MIKPWIVIGDIEDNPDIEDYLGNFEVFMAYKWNRHTFGLRTRNNLQSGFSRGAFQFDWSCPIYRRLRFYTQYFNGYGESLIDYAYFNNTLGMGLSFTDYF